MFFGQKWKIFDSVEHGIDNNKLPSMTNAARTEQYTEAMALSTIVDVIMLDDSVSCVVYSNDGSLQTVTGSYVVQFLTVNRVQRSLPTFDIFTETKDSLKKITIATLDVLTVSCGHRYSTSEILKQVTFTMTDSTAHNIGVMDLVCNALNVENIPQQRLCNVHPLIMFQNQIQEMCRKIHDSLGKQRIKESFLVDVEFQSESFSTKALKFLSNFINSDYSN